MGFDAGKAKCGRTLFDKIWESHVVAQDGDEAILYIDRHLLHEVTSPQAFDILRLSDLPVRQPGCTVGVADHNTPTWRQERGICGVADPLSREQLLTFERNCSDHGIRHIGLGDPSNGIVHVVAPEQGLVHPGMTIACGDSHTGSHGGIGALGLGIGTSEVAHVLATQTLRLERPRNMRIRVSGQLASGVSAKDLALAIIAQLGSSGGVGHVVEYCGEAVSALSVESRITLCNMSVEAGARAGIIGADARTYEYLRDFCQVDRALLQPSPAHRSDVDAVFGVFVEIDACNITPMVSWGTSVDQSIGIDQTIPDPTNLNIPPSEKAAYLRALDYMGLLPGQPMAGLPVDRVFIGSCTNSRIEDLREVARVVRGKRVSVPAIIVPGSARIAAQAENEGLADIFLAAGFDWRQPGCSMCTAMNGDELAPGERCASTSNRNFENRQGKLGRTHLMSPAMAASAAVQGRIVDCRS
jgi:3-isopropylmalate/(R)-2-methylmalate dehydratase large subunit